MTALQVQSARNHYDLTVKTFLSLPITATGEQHFECYEAMEDAQNALEEALEAHTEAA